VLAHPPGQIGLTPLLYHVSIVNEPYLRYNALGR
jgi:hypothetical protein